MPIHGFYDASDLSLKKALIKFAIANKVLHKTDQPNEAILTSCDKGVVLRNAVRNKSI
jgi:hypothetical protein